MLALADVQSGDKGDSGSKSARMHGATHLGSHKCEQDWQAFRPELPDVAEAGNLRGRR